MNKKKGLLLILLGCIFLISSSVLYGYNQDEDTRAAESASQVLLYFQTQEAPEIGIEIPYEMTPAGATESTASVPVVDQTMKTLNIEGNEYIGYLSIPDLSLELPVMNQWDYTRLKIAPCLYYGSVFTDDLVIAAHNYKSHFGKLEELSLGSFVDFTDAEGTVHRYRVEKFETLMPEDVELMLNSGYDLSLYTCTYGGRSRLTVRCNGD